MNFISIDQYFYKLQSVLFLLLMVPLLVFSALYLLMDASPPDPPREYFVAILSAVALSWLIAVLLINKKIKSARNEQGLGAKLDKYFKITIVRYRILSGGSFLLALGLYLTGSDVFTAGYVAGLVLAGMLWPRSRKVCKDLKLKGDEREMVYFRKDTF